ncbi:peroxisomal ATPase PEX6 isoform X1 [Cryptomeria japonica]|uniref:peroxisomal ATPase PEX6 isoform X1 n=1 Tax=Cryptomeria japonica TaxID=3369 RepID=UPI0025AD1DD1|nr:peroxisomal ATPase PEX6 isoform X1 [Cryptomeria japonica]XP_057837643.1 peroxisomal ATPase PEX6 isoform X1 [Cryptomeria japonica]
MGGRRKALVLGGTTDVVNSILAFNKPTSTEVSSSLRLSAGLLHVHFEEGSSLQDLLGERGGKETAFDDAVIVGVAAATLRELSLTSGSLVIVKDAHTNLGRLARVLVLDPPDRSSADFNQSQKLLFSHLPCTKHMKSLLSAYCLPRERSLAIDPHMAYLSPQLAFNIGLHIACLKVLIGSGQDSFASLFLNCSFAENKYLKTTAVVDIIPYSDLHQLHCLVPKEKVPRNQNCGFEYCKPDMPRYASHLRISFVKIPSSRIFDKLRTGYPVEVEERQEMIDAALHCYFKVDRLLARGDIFSIQLAQNCRSDFCSNCDSKTRSLSSDNVIYFKVMAMEPNEVILRVNCNQTALVLGGSVPSLLPPAFLATCSVDCTPLQQDIAQQLAFLLAPCMYPSAFSFKFKTTVLLEGPSGCGKRTIVRQVAKALGLHVVEYNCHDFLGASDRKTSVALGQAFSTAQGYAPVILLLRHFNVLATSTNGNLSSDQTGSASQIASVLHQFTEAHLSKKEHNVDPVEIKDDLNLPKTWGIKKGLTFLVAAADSTENITPSIRRCFSHEITIGAPTEVQRIKLLSQSIHGAASGPDNDIDLYLKDIAGQTSGFMPRDIRAIIADAGASLVSRIEKSKKNELIEFSQSFDVRLSEAENRHEFSNAEEHFLCKQDLEQAFDRIKKRTASSLGTPKVPNVKWEDVGGLEDVKKAILDTVQLPLLHKELFSSGIRQRSGVLLYGPPGTGKTLLAKAVATECSLNFLSVKGPELINMYIGESEKNVRDIFQKARAARPCIIFFDELDALAPARGASGDSGGVMDRVVSQMLAEIDGLNETTQDLFIIGASNRPDLIDPALLRPGRFDKLLYVGISSDSSFRERVLGALTRKFKLHENVSLSAISKRCPPNFTGADMYALCADAWLQAVKRNVADKMSNTGDVGEKHDSVIVELVDFVKALGELSPSLSLAELSRYEKLREQFEGQSK